MNSKGNYVSGEKRRVTVKYDRDSGQGGLAVQPRKQYLVRGRPRISFFIKSKSVRLAGACGRV